MIKDGIFIYAEKVCTSQPKSGESHVYRNPKVIDGLDVFFDDSIRTVKDLFLDTVQKHPSRDFLGRRLVNSEGVIADTFTFETYEEVKDVATALGSGMVTLNLAEEKAQYKNFKMKFISIFGKNTREWIITDIANSLYGFTTMPIYDTLGIEAVDHMYNETELSTVFLTCEHIEKVSKRVQGGTIPHLKNLVVLNGDSLTPELRKAAQAASLRLLTFNEVVAEGRKSIVPYASIQENDISFFSYTSGTTGTPKGAMISHRNLMSAITGTQGDIFPLESLLVHISYLPLAHIFERYNITNVIQKGGKVGVFNGDVRKLKDDLAILKPNMFTSVPRLFNKFYQKINAQFDALTGCKSWMVKKAVAAKIEEEKRSGAFESFMYDSLVFSKVKQVLGGNCELMITASAPISIDVMRFLKIAFCCPFLNGYGQTEGCGACFGTHIGSPQVRVVAGGPTTMVEYKLIDVADMKYFVTDTDDEGRPSPRGEILIRGASIIPGYYKQPEKTAEAIDSEGWLHSGDIGQILPGDNSLRIIDRRKNIFKLSQGEYVAPDKLENIYKTAIGLGDIFIYGDSLKSAIVAIINVDPDQLATLSTESGVSSSDLTAFCADQKVHDLFTQKLNDSHKDAGLKGFERIKKFHIDPIQFIDNGLVTATFKLKRNVAKEHYKQVVEKLYEGLD